MTIILLAVGVLLAIAALAARQGSLAPGRTQPGDEHEPADEAEEIAPPDQLELLQHYGTPDTAESLRQQGIDVEALGYRPPRD